METQVLVVGAGPTGLMLAIQLARRGLQPIVIDRHAGPAEQSRAMAVQARTLEIYDRMGLAPAAVERGAIGTGANMWSNGRWSARIPLVPRRFNSPGSATKSSVVNFMRAPIFRSSARLAPSLIKIRIASVSSPLEQDNTVKNRIKTDNILLI